MKLSKMKKDDIELLSYTNIAKLYLEENKTTMTTADLFKEVCKLLNLSDEEYQERIADFFESLTTSSSNSSHPRTDSSTKTCPTNEACNPLSQTVFNSSTL